MGSSTSTGEKSVSTCANHPTPRTHHFEIQNYSRTKGRGMSIYSRHFCTSGGHRWRIRCYLNGENYPRISSDYISLFLEYRPRSLSNNSKAKTRAKFSFSLLEHATGAAIYMKELDSCVFGYSWGMSTFIKREILEESLALKDDSFTIICNVTVLAEPRTSVAKRVPYTVENSNFFNAYEARKDIIFEVDGKSFSANSTVVASGSAQLSNMIKESNDKAQTKIKLSDIKAPVFEALLEYICTEELPENERLVSTAGMVPDLLDAADRFGMCKLRTRCERQLLEGLDVQNVCDVLVLAEQCRLIKLKDACLGYLSAPEALVPAMATEGFIRLVQKYPTIAREISSEVKFQKK